MSEEIKWGPWQLCVAGALLPRAEIQWVHIYKERALLDQDDFRKGHREPWAPEAVAFRVPVESSLQPIADADRIKPGDVITYAPTPKPQKWLLHDGWACPVPGETLVKVKEQDGHGWLRAWQFHWPHVTHYRIKRKQPAQSGAEKEPRHD